MGSAESLGRVNAVPDWLSFGSLLSLESLMSSRTVPMISILWLGEMESLVCNFYLSVAARTIVWADPSLRYTRMLLGR